MRRLLHYGSCKRNRGLNSGHACNCTRIQLCTMHNRRIELVLAVPGVNGALTRVEQGGILHPLDNRYNHIEALFTGLELPITLGYRAIEKAAVFSLDLGAHAIALDRPRSAM